ncbi:hypothetical protein CDL12_23374 [Handroanthus impetiginosus]|uniref:UDP-glucuronosyl and UDP-glucosyl transferase n=1 Tax=Handroanthus impetiginosus TaxID=429701 RepID=A0A2G9GGF9_9LAMI|nr:hypothetical protein CDL12_23374 [Handroanthus impetiginosus]
MGNPHIIVMPYPAQGHVIPMLELSQQLTNHHFKFTFVNTDFDHRCITKSLSDSDNILEQVTMLNPRRIGAMGGQKLRKGKGLRGRLSVRRRLVFNIPRMVSDGIVDDNGKPLKNQTIHFSPAMPPINSNNFIWTHFGDLSAQRRIFHILVRNNNFSSKFTNWLICNSSYDLEPGVFSLYQNIVPIGPLLVKNRLGKSLTIFDQEQFEELALGLELTNRPFLWVVRQDITSGTGMKAYHQTIHLSHSDIDIIYPKGFKERVEKSGQRVRWAPQEEVLSHPSIALFISHCGWNSTIEGVSNGVPFLCWPHFLDQFINRSYIVDCWEVGLELEKEECGIVRKEELRNKVELVMSDKRYKTRALNLQSKVVSSAAEGSSQKNFSNFADWIKENKVIY